MRNLECKTVSFAKKSLLCQFCQKKSAIEKDSTNDLSLFCRRPAGQNHVDRPVGHTGWLADRLAGWRFCFVLRQAEYFAHGIFLCGTESYFVAQGIVLYSTVSTYSHFVINIFLSIWMVFVLHEQIFSNQSPLAVPGHLFGGSPFSMSVFIFKILNSSLVKVFFLNNVLFDWHLLLYSMSAFAWKVFISIRMEFLFFLNKSVLSKLYPNQSHLFNQRPLLSWSLHCRTLSSSFAEKSSFSKYWLLL